jgi:hypothetical protein
MSSGGFSGIHKKLLQSLGERAINNEWTDTRENKGGMYRKNN